MKSLEGPDQISGNITERSQKKRNYLKILNDAMQEVTSYKQRFKNF